jgi:hypothetical protein
MSDTFHYQSGTILGDVIDGLKADNARLRAELSAAHLGMAAVREMAARVMKAMRRDVIILCEATEDSVATYNEFERGRVYEAKGIRRALGDALQTQIKDFERALPPSAPDAPAVCMRCGDGFDPHTGMYTAEDGSKPYHGHCLPPTKPTPDASAGEWQRCNKCGEPIDPSHTSMFAKEGEIFRLYHMGCRPTPTAPSAPAPLTATLAGKIAGEAYQVIGALAFHAGLSDEPEVKKALDYFSKAEEITEDMEILPWGFPGHAVAGSARLPEEMPPAMEPLAMEFREGRLTLQGFWRALRQKLTGAP